MMKSEIESSSLPSTSIVKLGIKWCINDLMVEIFCGGFYKKCIAHNMSIPKKYSIFSDMRLING